MSAAKNPYDVGTPEWLLFSNIESKASEARAFAADAERYTEKANRAREQSEAFRIALANLTGIPS